MNTEFYKVINRRRTIRDFEDRPIPADALERIISAGLQAPTYNHNREWEFVILQGHDEKENALQFVKAFAERYSKNDKVPENASLPQKMYAYAMPRQYTMLMESGCVILPFFKGTDQGMPFASVWCCIENIFLAAAAEGLACSMRIPVGNEGRDVAGAVKAPGGYMMPCYIGVGYPKEDAMIIEQVKRDSKSVMHMGKW